MRMLDKDPVKRISVDEILEHPWILELKKSKAKRSCGIFGRDEIFDEEVDTPKDDQDYSDDYINEEDKTIINDEY